MGHPNKWYEIKNVTEVDSPSIVLYKNRFVENIRKVISMVEGNVDRLMPHIKTNKIPQVIQTMVSLGITRMKTSTISEAELAAKSGVRYILLAHQLVGPKIDRFFSLAKHYEETMFATIVDNKTSVDLLNQKSSLHKISTDVYVDINNGMNRSGIRLGKPLKELIDHITQCESLNFKGLHVYDGHIRDADFDLRKQKIEDAFIEIDLLFNELKSKHPHIEMITGGTPSFTTHLLHKQHICSPGTFVFWDWGYNHILREQEFEYAALVICRVISKPQEEIITVDLGHKAIASENPIEKRVRFLNIGDYKLLSQSEEHGILRVERWDDVKVGDVIYGVPYHICPTINLHDEVSLVDNGLKYDSWQITGRSRKLTF